MEKRSEIWYFECDEPGSLMGKAREFVRCKLYLVGVQEVGETKGAL
jgi:hypothetical protein